jgi:hypothetical protein
MIFSGHTGFSKRRRAGDPAMFCFPITSKFLHNSPTIAAFEKEKKGRQEQAARSFFTDAIRIYRQRRFPIAAGSSSRCCQK